MATVRQAEPEVVFHLASTRFNPPGEAQTHLRVNVLGTSHVLEALREFPDTTLVFTGSTAAYGAGSHLREDRPLSPETVFGASKACASVLVQTYVRLHGLRAIELRLFTPYGPWESARRLIPHTILSALAGRDVSLTSGEQERDFVYVDDVVDGLVLASTRDVAPGSVLNIGSGSGTTVRNVAGTVLDLMGNPVRMLLGAVPTRSDEIMTMSADIDAAGASLGWRPRTRLRDGLMKSIAWFTENPELAETLP
jgi:nucleoside-diphosphate-sugar epimerase